MSFPTFTISQLGSSSNTTSYAVTWPSTDDGDLIVLIAQNDGSGDFITPPTGQWLDNVIFAGNDGGCGHLASYYECDGTESGTFTLAVSSGETLDVMLLLIPAGEWDTGEVPEGIIGTGSSTANPDVGTLTPSWGSSDTLYICCSMQDANEQDPTVYPLPDNQTQNSVNGDLAICSDELTDSSLDPSAWTWSGTNGRKAGIIAVKGVTSGGALTASGTPSITGPTASGTATIFKRATSTATMATVVAAGVASVISPPLTGSGTPSIEVLTSSGTATIGPKTITGTPTLDALIASGSVTLGAREVSGTPSLDALTASGSVFQTLKPSGTPEIPTISAVGEAGLGALTGSGTPGIDALTATGAVVQTLMPSGTPSIDELTASGTATIPAVTGFPTFTISQQGTASNVTTYDVTWPSTDDGDLIILLAQCDGSADTITPPAGQWTDNTLASANDGGCGHLVTYYECDGTESGTFTLGITTAESVDVMLLLIPSGEWDTNESPEILHGTGSVTANPDVGELTASWGSASNTFICYSMQDANEQDPTVYPLPDNQTQNSVNGDLAVCSDELAQASLDPTAWTWSGSNGRKAGVLVVKGAASAGTGYGSPSIDVITASGTAGIAGLQLTASGTPAIDALTASASANQILKPSGAVTLDGLTASATATASTALLASGNPSIEVLTSAGILNNFEDAEGFPTLEVIIASGVAEKIAGTLTASGTSSVTVLTASATASLAALTGSGTPFLAGLTASGQAIQTHMVSGSPIVPVITSSGSGEIVGKLGSSGAPSIDVITASGSVVQTYMPSGNPEIDALTASGAITVARLLTASGTPSIEPLTASTVTEESTASSGGISKRQRAMRRRYLVEIDGKWFDADTVKSVHSLLEQAKEVARESAEKDVANTPFRVRLKPPKIRVKTASGKQSNSVTIQRDVAAAQRAINKIYLDAQRQIDQIREISHLMRRKIEMDEEEDIIKLLLL